MTTDFWLVLAFAVPAIHLAMNVSLLWHEIVGHGVVAIALGGEFNGLRIGFSQGWCQSHPKQDGKPWRRVAHLAGGIILTTIFGIGCFIAAWYVTNGPIVTIMLTLIGVTAVLDSGPYLFWNAVKPVPPGDVGRILELWQANWRGASLIRGVALCLGAVITFVGVVSFLWIIFAQLQSFAFGPEPLTGSARLIMVAAFTAIASTPWLLDPWDDLVPGVGIHPKLWGIVTTLVAGAVIQLHMPVSAANDYRGILTPALVGCFWGMSLVWSLVILVWLRRGVTWNRFSRSSPILRLVNVLIIQAHRDSHNEIRISLDPETGVNVLGDDEEYTPFPEYLFGDVIDGVLHLARIKKRPKSLVDRDASILIRIEAVETRWKVMSTDLSKQIVLTRVDA